MTSLLASSSIQLVQPGDTRWTSNYRAVKAILKLLPSIIAALQEIYTRSGDLSCEAGGILMFLQNKSNIALLFALNSILKPIAQFTLQLQSQHLHMPSIPASYEAVVASLKNIICDSCEYTKKAEDLIKEHDISIIQEPGSTEKDLHKSVVVPYINALIKNLDKRFNDSVMSLCSASTLFSEQMDAGYDATEKLNEMAEAFEFLDNEELQSEWKVFKNLLNARKRRGENIEKLLQTLCASASDLGDSYCQIAILSKIIMSCPLGTAEVERTFSTMARLCTRLRNRMGVETLGICMMIAIEGPEKLTLTECSDIVRLWYKQKPFGRRISIPL